MSKNRIVTIWKVAKDDGISIDCSNVIRCFTNETCCGEICSEVATF